VYIREIDNFIQGVPFDDTIGVADTMVEMIAAMNGDPTPLRFANTDARLYGFDIDAGYNLAGPLRLDAVASYVRAERRDIEDDLYRIAPFSLTTGLTWEAEAWSSTLEVRGVAKQDKVSLSNGEAETPGYVLVNLYADWQVREGVRLSAGVENLLDHTWRDHLSGYNRNAAGDVALGTRLPGAARGAFIRLSVAR
jgi:iron complex outermembrane receptor protein